MDREQKAAESERVRRQNLRELLDEYIREHAEFSAAELADAQLALQSAERVRPEQIEQI